MPPALRSRWADTHVKALRTASGLFLSSAGAAPVQNGYSWATLKKTW